MIFVGSLDAANAQQRYQGIKEPLQGSNVLIVDVRTDNTEPRARQVECRGHAGELSRHCGVSWVVVLQRPRDCRRGSADGGPRLGKVKIIAF